MKNCIFATAEAVWNGKKREKPEENSGTTIAKPFFIFDKCVTPRVANQ
jgi:hypothetical protein